MKIVSIHQPQYLPWVPYFDKIFQSADFIFLDNVQFQKNGLQNRNQVKGAEGPQWLTIPVNQKLEQTIDETKIANLAILQKHIKTIKSNYNKAPYFNEIYPILSESFANASHSLADLCCDLTSQFLSYLGYEGRVCRNSELRVEGKSSDLVLNICKKVGANIYLSGQGGKNYLDQRSFDEAGIKVVFQNYKNQEYQQVFPKSGYCPNLSIIDLLFNKGKESSLIMKKGRFPNEHS